MSIKDLQSQYEYLCENLTKKHYVLKNKDYVLRHVDLHQYDTDDEGEEFRLKSVQEKVGQKCAQVTAGLWRGHTTFTHPMKGLPAKLGDEYPQLKHSLTQAYCKFIQILEANPELTHGHIEANDEEFRSLHLCEAPGNFVRALGDYLPEAEYRRWIWRMNSLNPYHEATDLRQILFDDTFMIRNMHNMVFGTDNTGNVATFSEDYVGNMIGETGKFHLVTCDGSFDCRDLPGEQERITYNLFNQCWRAASKCIQRNGCFVMKIYTFFTDEMQNLLTQISNCFQRVVFQKPACSKPGNSEIYLICIGFDSNVVNATNNDNAARVIPALRSAANFFSAHQREMIQYNLKSYAKLTPRERIALVIKKTNAILTEMNTHFTFLAKAEERRMKTEVYPKLDLNPWLRSAWAGIHVKEAALEDYLYKISKAEQFPVTVSLESDPLPTLEKLLQSIPRVDCLSRHPFITASHRCARIPFPDRSPALQSTMFADCKLLQYAREINWPYFDLCHKYKKAHKKLRHEMVQECDGLYVDSAFMCKNAWLELCTIVANGSPVGCKYPRRNHLVQLIDDEHPHLIDRVHIYMTYGEQLVLTRFAGSVIFFLAEFFEKIAFDRKGIHFLHRKHISPDLSNYINEVAVGLPDSYDLLQFVPSLVFASPKLHQHLLEYNNNSLLRAIEGIQYNACE